MPTPASHCRSIALLATASLLGFAPAAFAQNPPVISDASTARDGTLAKFAELRFGVLIRFNMGTFSDKGGSGDEAPGIFHPAKLDCGQWAKSSAGAGARYALLTVKGGDGFCLWKSNTTGHDVASGSFGRDVVREYVDAFRRQGVAPGLCFSMRDRHAKLGEKGPMAPAQLKLVLDQLTELLTGYGPVPILMIEDWSTVTGDQNTPYSTIREHIRKLQPDCLVIDRSGVPSPWNTDVVHYEPDQDGLPPAGNTFPSQIVLASTGLRFEHAGTPFKSDTPPGLFLSRLASCEQRYCNGLLEVGPGRDGLFGDSALKLLSEIGGKRAVAAGRAPLPKQPAVQIHPMIPTNIRAEGSFYKNLIDGMGGGPDTATSWIASTSHGRITLDYGEPVTIGTISILPQQFPAKNGRRLTTMSEDDPRYPAAVKATADIRAGRTSAYRIFAGDALEDLRIIAYGKFADTKAVQVGEFPPVKARFMAFESLATRDDQPVVIDEIAFGAPN